MTLTPPRGAGGTATTHTARNRSRRRQNAAGKPRHADQAELAPPRRRSGRHTADEPVPDGVAGASVDDVEFPAPAWDPWATSTNALPAGARTDPWENTNTHPEGAWIDPWGNTNTHPEGARPDPWGNANARREGAWAGRWGDTTEADASRPNGWTDTTGGGIVREFGWGGDVWADVSDSWTEGAGQGPEDPGTADSRSGPDGNGRGLWLELGEVDGVRVEPGRVEPGRVDASCVDAGARGPYRKRGEAGRRNAGRRHIGRWSHARRPRSAYLNAALVRCGLYLGALSAAIAAAEPLGRVAWPVPAVMVLLGWTAAQGLTSMGVTVARRGGPVAAARVVGAGFAAVIAFWCALVWVAPDALLGPDRLLAATAGVGGLVTLATVTAALVTRAEGAVAGWYAPCWLLAAVVMIDATGVPEAALIPVQTLLPAAIVAVMIRAFRPALLPASGAPGGTAGVGGEPRLAGPAGRVWRFGTCDRRRTVAYLIIGAAQAVSVILLWRGGPAVMPLPAALPLLLAVPLLEGLIGWHTDRLDALLHTLGTPGEFDRHVRNVTAITLAGLVPPLAAGCGLLVAAYRLPYGFSVVPGARDAVLVLAAATLLGGVFAVTFLLAARTRHGIAATLAAIPPLAATVLALSASPAGQLPAAVAVLAATHLAGLLIVALTAADLRRTP